MIDCNSLFMLNNEFMKIVRCVFFVVAFSAFPLGRNILGYTYEVCYCSKVLMFRVYQSG